jgi:hypothetical protein
MSPMDCGSYNLVRREVKGVWLEAPKEFWDYLRVHGEEGLRKEGYGCGPGKGIGDWLVPDRMWFLCVWICCTIHDWMYRDKKACSERDKEVADQILLANLTEWIDCKSWPVIKQIRMYRAMSYYNAVNSAGDSSFWCDGKVKP